MANKRISELTQVIIPESGDVFPIVNSNETKKITFSNTTTAVRNSNTPLTASSITVGDGNIVPTTPQGATLGTIDKPFRDIFLQSGSISIESDTPGDPSAIISNKDGNLEISVGGMLLFQPDASFIAPTGSFSYLSGSFNHIGSANRLGDTIITGSVDIAGSFEADLQENYVWLGDSNSRSQPVSLDTLAASGSLIKKSYGSFYDTTSQTASLADTIYTVTHNSTDLSNGVSIVNGSRITISETGTYTIISTHQYVHSTGGVVTITGWLRKNGVDVDYSGTDLRLKGNGDKDLYAINYFVEAEAGDYYELMWSANGTDTFIVATPARTSPTRPAVPSVITTVNKVG